MGTLVLPDLVMSGVYVVGEYVFERSMKVALRASLIADLIVHNLYVSFNVSNLICRIVSTLVPSRVFMGTN
jgi:hypothetical protein